VSWNAVTRRASDLLAGLTKRGAGEAEPVSPASPPLDAGPPPDASPPDASPPDAGPPDRYAAELSNFRAVEQVHDLPAIYHLWSARYVRPKLQELGYDTLDDMWLDAYRRVAAGQERRGLRICSIGAGNCDLEVALATQLREHGIQVDVIDCLELNTAMLARGREHAAAADVVERLRFLETDLNEWTAEPGAYDVVVANHSLHHIEALEHVFDQIAVGLRPGGRFLINDMIGRNGHQRWPEALEIVHGVWRAMPDRYKYNQQLRRFEALYENWDCSGEGFEGIRAQDILPLLNERFDYEVFVPFGNVVDVFVDRGFGHNFDADDPEDRAFIEKLGLLDDLTIDLGIVKPTHLLAVATTAAPAVTKVYRHWTPEFSVRHPDPV
jgi:2-polyprenyl-3-methyl-5-hydroxy-6-metoxy-1,4-benzoquinol methylase